MEAEEVVARNQQLRPDKQRELLALLLSDPLLQDVPREITTEHVDALIARERGLAVNVWLERYDGIPIPLVIGSNTTVHDLKNQIKAQIANKLYNEGQGVKKISWKHVWTNNCLVYEKQRLLEDDLNLQNLGIAEGARIYFGPFKPPDRRGRY